MIYNNCTTIQINSIMTMHNKFKRNVKKFKRKKIKLNKETM